MATSIFEEKQTNVIPIESNSKIKVHELTNYPDKAWVKSKKGIKMSPVNKVALNTQVLKDKIRIVCISDTHDHTNDMTHNIPSGDILIHSGDFTRRGRNDEVRRFTNFLDTLDFKYKIVIAGNHELSFDQNKGLVRILKTLDLSSDEEKTSARLSLQHCIYLQDSGIELFGFLKIWGSPWQPTHRGWAFNADRGETILKIWNQIPDDTDILITHGPPLGFGDLTSDNHHVGCVELLSTIRERVKPKLHIFGHIHSGHGIWTDETTTYINASICNDNYQAINEPILFDIPIPDGFSKTTEIRSFI